MSEITLTAAGRAKLPAVIRFAYRQFQCRSVYYTDGFPTLPPSLPPDNGIMDHNADIMRYVSYCMDRLDNGGISQDHAKALLVGLRTCGAMGEEVADRLKKVLKK